jgi:hypothetical protein
MVSRKYLYSAKSSCERRLPESKDLAAVLRALNVASHYVHIMSRKSGVHYIGAIF